MKKSFLQHSIIFLVILSFITVGCQKQAERVDMEAENKALAQRWNDEIWNNANTAAMDELLDESFVFNYAPPDVEANLEGYKQTVAYFHSIFTDMHLTIEDMIVAPCPIITLRPNFMNSESHQVSAKWLEKSILTPNCLKANASVHGNGEFRKSHKAIFFISVLNIQNSKSVSPISALKTPSFGL